MGTGRGIPLGAGLLAALCLATAATAQNGSVPVVAGERYAAGPLQERLLGNGYRTVWTTRAGIPLLDLATFAGGLLPLRRGGGRQTRSLRFRGQDGREYNFRSVDKEITQGLPDDLRETLIDRVIQDQVSALHPAATVVATGLLDAVGILNPGPRLVVLPDDPRLGEFQSEFAGLLGTLEVHADETGDQEPDFAGAAEVDGAEDVLAHIRDSPEHRADARAYLRERLLSLLMGDWDRHADQYRWARFDSAGIHWWTPVPEDRDFAFSHYDGLLTGLAGFLFPEAAPFSDRYPADLTGLTQNSRVVDRLLLAGLSWPTWRQTVADLQRELSDEKIEEAVRRMPPEYFSASGLPLIRTLQARRDGMDGVAERFYRQLAAVPEIHGTDAAERVEVARLADGSVRVLVVPAGSDTSAAPRLLERTFSPAETDELRLYLHGGDDAVAVTGSAPGGVPVRIVGGLGADTLRDLSRTGGGGWVAFYDADEGGTIEPGPATIVVDRAPHDEPLWIPGEVLPPRDWGSQRSWFSPWAGYEETEGIIVGGGPTWTWYGFRRLPHAGRIRLRGLYGLGSGGAGLDATGDFVGVGSTRSWWIHSRASGLEAFRFHGQGNASPERRAGGGEIIRYDQRLFEARMRFQPQDGLTLGLGPVIEYIDPDAASGPAGAVAAERRGYGKAGLAGELGLDTRQARGARDGGFRLDAEGRFFPEAWGLQAPFGRLRAEAAGYAPLPLRSLLATRVGAAQLWGDAPLLEGVSLGGSETLRGFPYQRFTGDALLYGGLELRTFVTRARLLVNGDLGVLGFTEAGRVYVDGASEGGWNSSYGAGVWFESLGYAVSATYARGEDHRVYFELGLPF